MRECAEFQPTASSDWARRASALLANVEHPFCRGMFREMFERFADGCEQVLGMTRADAEWAAYERLKMFRPK